MEQIKYKTLNRKKSDIHQEKSNRKVIDEIIEEIESDDLDSSLLEVVNVVDKMLSNIPSDVDIHEFMRVIDSIDNSL